VIGATGAELVALREWLAGRRRRPPQLKGRAVGVRYGSEEEARAAAERRRGPEHPTSE
jgi:hypothetical protein